MSCSSVLAMVLTAAMLIVRTVVILSLSVVLARVKEITAVLKMSSPVQKKSMIWQSHAAQLEIIRFTPSTEQSVLIIPQSNYWTKYVEV